MNETTRKCPRCKGRRQICADGDPDMILSCPDCEGTGEDLDDDGADERMDAAMKFMKDMGE